MDKICLRIDVHMPALIHVMGPHLVAESTVNTRVNMGDSTENNNSTTKKNLSSGVYLKDEFNTSSTIHLSNSEVSTDLAETEQSWATREEKYSTSDFGAVLHVIKSCLGSGFLGMPFAYHNAGLLLGFVSSAFIGIVCTHCQYLVVKCSQDLCTQLKVPRLTYTETIVNSIKYSPNKRLSKYSPFVKWIVNLFMLLAYYGINTVYVILIASTFKQVIENHTEFSFNIRWYALALVVVLLPVGIIRHMKFLVPFSFIANILLFTGTAMTLYYIFQDLPPLTSRPLAVDLKRFPMFFSIAVAGMEGIGTTMPIENAMRKPSHFIGCPGILYIGMAVVCSMFTIFGFLGYLKFGDAIQGSITLNLPQDVLAELVKICVALAILFTYGLQLTASIVVVWSGLEDKFSEKNRTTGYYIVRASLIIGTVLIAIAVPNLSPVLSLVGAVGFSSLGLLFPPLAETSLNWGSHSFAFILIKNIILFIIYLFAMISGSIISIQEIIDQYKLS